MSTAETACNLPSNCENWMLLFAVGIGTMFIAAHTSAVTATLPVIAAQLDSSITSAQWILIGYTLTLTACLQVFGRMGDQIGFRRVYIVGMTVFALASLVCVFTKTTASLGALRLCQGIGGAMISATSVAILASHIAPSRLGSALGWQAGMTYCGLALGPVLGGYLVERFDWRALFAMNLPVIVLAVALALGNTTEQETKSSECWSKARTRKERDWSFVAGLTWIICLIVLMMALHGKLWLFCIAAALGLFSIALDCRSKRPLLPVHLFRNKDLLPATLGEVIHYFCIYAVNVLMPLYLARSRGFTGVQMGLLLSLQYVTRALTAVCSGVWSDHANVGVTRIVGMLMLIAGLFSLCGLSNNTSYVQISAVLTLMGVGTGIFVPANTKVLLCAASPELYGRSVGLLGTARNLGMTLGAGWAVFMYSSFGAGESANTSLNGIRVGFLTVTMSALLYTFSLLPGVRTINPLKRYADVLQIRKESQQCN